MTPEKRAAFEIIVANNAYAVQMENERVAKAEAEALAKGKAEGKVESNMVFARLMKLNSEPIEKIKDYTGLSETEIDAL